MSVRILLGPVMAGLLVAGCLPGDDGDPGRGGSGGSNSDNGGSGGGNDGTGGNGGSAPGTCDEANAALNDCMSKACDPARAAVEACLERIFAQCGGNGGGNDNCDQGGGFFSCDPDGCTVGDDGNIICPDGLASDCAVRERIVACPDGRICTVDDAGLIHCDDNGGQDPTNDCDPFTACADEIQAAGTCGDACATEADDQQRLCGALGG